MHHTENGCALLPGDLLGSGTVSGPNEDELGCLKELTLDGMRPLQLPSGEQRIYLEDGDEVTFQATCYRDGFVPIGFGECTGRVPFPDEQAQYQQHFNKLTGDQQMDLQKPIRRIVTGNDEQGHSRIIEDGPSPAACTIAERPGYRVTNLWATEGSPAKVDGPDLVTTLQGVLPPKSGTVLRIIDIPPEPKDPAERERAMKASFGKLFKDADHNPKPGQHPGMHVTTTVDYAILLAGELAAIMDEGEVVMKAGDVLIQRGTNHGWSNRSDAPARRTFSPHSQSCRVPAIKIHFLSDTDSPRLEVRSRQPFAVPNRRYRLFQPQKETLRSGGGALLNHRKTPDAFT
jgi:hypothetical protein